MTIQKTFQVCPGTLAKGYDTYSSTCLKYVFNGKKVSPILPYNSPLLDGKDGETFEANKRRLSISGVQEKFSVIQIKNQIRLTEEGESGTFILKPIPRDLMRVDQVPANEHLTMQIAKQVYQIKTAENALVFFQNGDPAYITKRFDIVDEKTKWAKEDFATLANKTSETDGENYKYNFSYEGIGKLIKTYVPAYRVEMEKFFSLVVFNYLFSNGDAHLKNFSILETEKGDHILSPAYDLLNTRIHVNDADFALTEGLFDEEYYSDEMKANGWCGRDDFEVFGDRIGLKPQQIAMLLEPFLKDQPMVHELIQNSFLNEETKALYKDHYLTRLKKLTNTL
ncbi:MAG: type II toxin-antitoxin system HipA family toxin [Bacteroidetes bacterium]|nr:MAG: type II toxin-antitoxin system HipA family toxin [Bacteroidota bacterium]